MTPAPAREDVATPATMEDRFEECVRALTPALMAYFVRRVDPAEDAADCVSELLMILWRQRDRLPEGEAEIRAWSFGVAKGVLANYRRGRIRRRALSEKLRQGLVHEPPALQDPYDEIFGALSRLRPKDRELVMLIVWDGFGVAEAGAVLGLSAAASRSRYSRVRKELKLVLAQGMRN
ncbi:RNA polymerase sigma factor [Arthrobacter sp. ISL-95]|uniref:RNA polymerase sigma factor n=1 Tax=Arthrobacter sp. ISL-95 TaxID=2819116 RepID=UPI001BE86238|nr:sigma-70 family RNA polymerase sigma factor [Arthrobacter sp. ISL-95]MBT2586946.1 sigma-70 family RNA polymerase sigma factor [Arthrobacter sp. ISL-95]